MNDNPRLFLGYDQREAVGFHVCVQSILEKAKRFPVSITPISGERRDGTNDFIYARFLVPYLCNFEGWALFIDGSDMLLREDIGDLWCLRDGSKAIQVVKQDYAPRSPRKYIGTRMESDNSAYPRKNWSSVMLINCSHPLHRALTPQFVAACSGSHLHRFAWLPDELVGELPSKWNVLVGELGETGECAIAHFTLGIPAMPHYHSCLHSGEWWKTLDRMKRFD